MREGGLLSQKLPSKGQDSFIGGGCLHWVISSIYAVWLKKAEALLLGWGIYSFPGRPEEIRLSESHRSPKNIDDSYREGQGRQALVAMDMERKFKKLEAHS